MFSCKMDWLMIRMGQHWRIWGGWVQWSIVSLWVITWIYSWSQMLYWVRFRISSWILNHKLWNMRIPIRRWCEPWRLMTIKHRLMWHLWHHRLLITIEWVVSFWTFYFKLSFCHSAKLLLRFAFLLWFFILFMGFILTKSWEFFIVIFIWFILTSWFSLFRSSMISRSLFLGWFILVLRLWFLFRFFLLMLFLFVENIFNWLFFNLFFGLLCFSVLKFRMGMMNWNNWNISPMRIINCCYWYFWFLLLSIINHFCIVILNFMISLV